MSLTLPKTCAMGGNKTGLVGTIGVALLNPDGTVHTARATAGIYEIGGGCYGKEIIFPDNWKGSLKWDTGGGSPVYATEDYDIEGLIDMIEEDTSKMNFTGDDIKATLDGEKVALSDATEAEIDRILTATEVRQFTIDDATATTTKFITDLTETANTFWPRAALLMTSGQNKGQIRGIKTYNGSTKEIQIQTPLSYAPANGDTAIILPARKFLTPDVLELAAAVEDELKSNHGEGSWKTATGFATPGDVKCGGGGGGGAIIERPDIWKPEEKLKLIEDIKKIYKMINELSSLQSTGLQNVKNNIESLKNSLIKLIKEEVALLVSLKKTISEQPQTDSSDALADSINQLIAKWDSVQKSILKPSDLFSLDNKLDDLTKVMVKSLSNKDLEKLVLGNGHE